MNDSYIGKREIEREHLGLFLEAYSDATGKTFSLIIESETPDFIVRDDAGQLIGIEMTQLRFSPDERHARQIYSPEPHDPDAWWRLIELMEQKERTLSKGNWPKCSRKILVVMLIDSTIEALAGATDVPDQNGFDEIWLADYTQVEAFGAVDLFAVVHPKLRGHFATWDTGQKPYG